MNNQLRSINNNSNSFQLVDIVANIASFNVDPQHKSINLEIINGMTFSFNWTNGKFNYMRNA